MTIGFSESMQPHARGLVEQDTVQRAAAFNRNTGRRGAIGQMLAAADSAPVSASPTSARPVSAEARQSLTTSTPK